MNNQHTVQFVRSGRGKAQCSPDADYPNGKVIDLGAKRSCIVDLPYPAPECGVHIVKCSECKASVAVTATGRPDDPTRLFMPCVVDSQGEA